MIAKRCITSVGTACYYYAEETIEEDSGFEGSTRSEHLTYNSYLTVANGSFWFMNTSGSFILNWMHAGLRGCSLAAQVPFVRNVIFYCF